MGDEPKFSAGAGRGRVNPKTIAEMEKEKKKPKKGIRGGIWTADSDVPAPENPDMGSAKYAKGGIVRGMGAAKRGGRFVRSC